MADIAEIGFRADTSDMVRAKRDVDALGPSAAKSEKSVDALNAACGELGSAAKKLMAAANGLITASEKLASVTNIAAGANDNEARAAREAATALAAKTQAANAAAAAERKAIAEVEMAVTAWVEEAAAIDAAAAAQKRYSGSVPIISRAKDWVGPWGAVRKELVAANDNAGAFKANVGNIAAQFQDIGVTAAMGMNPLLIALQQGTQLSAVLAMSMQNGETAVQALASAFKQIIGVTALVTIGVVALAAGLIQMVNWTKAAQFALNGLADILPVVAQYAAAAGAALAIAFAPSIAVAIWNITIAITSGLIAALGALVAAVGAIPLAIGLIIADLIIFRDAWTNVLGFDIVGIAKKAVNYIIGSFVGAYHDIQFIWKNFPDIIGAAALGAANLVIRAINAMVKAGATGINTLMGGIQKVANFIGADKAAQFFGFSGELPTIDVDKLGIDEIANDAADRLSKAVEGRNDQLQKDLTTDYLGALGGAINDASKWAADKLHKFSDTLGVDKTKKKGHHGKTDAEKFSDIVTGANNQIATLNAQQAALGMSAEKAAELKYQTQLLNEAAQKNIKLTPAQTAQLMALGKQMGDLEVATKTAASALDFVKDGFKGFVDDLASGLKQGQSFWEAFGNAALNVLDKIADKLLNDVMDALFQTQQAAAGGLGGAQSGGFFGSVLGWIGGLFGGGSSAAADPWAGLRMAKGGAFENGISGHSNSIVSRPTPFMFASGAGVMGEAGPEGILPLARMGNGDLGVQMQTTPNANSNVPIPVNINVRIDGANGDQHVIDLVNQGVSQGLETFNDTVLPGRVNEIANDRRVR